MYTLITISRDFKYFFKNFFFSVLEGSQPYILMLSYWKWNPYYYYLIDEDSVHR